MDGRPVKTPSKQVLRAPTEALARAVAAEWDAQDGEVDPGKMPLTRLTNSALDKVAVQFDGVAEMLADYGANDLLCYRAEEPACLVERQAVAWDPMLEWARETLGVSLVVQSGVMPIDQSEAAKSELLRRTKALDVFALTAFHELVTLPGSWILGYAVLREKLTPESAWDAALVDDYWQEEQWGADEEAVEMRQIKRDAFLIAHEFAKLCGQVSPLT